MFTPPKYVTCHVSRVTCHMSRVTCHVPHVTFFFFFFFSDKVVTYIGGGFVINGAYPVYFTRREKLLYSFGKKCLTLEESKDLFPKNNKLNIMNTRIPEEYQVTKTNTERFKNSRVLYIQRMINKKSPFLV